MDDLRGYTLPLSPSGRASFVTPPPWHFSGELIWVDYKADPAAAASFLPPGLDRGERAGTCAAVFVDWQWCSDSREELEDPACCQFKECFLLVGCSYGGAPAARMPYVWVDRALPLVRGWIQGVPKLLGAVDLTRAIPIGRAGARRRPGERFAATVTVGGRRVLEASVTLVESGAEPPALDEVPVINSRVFPAWGHPEAEVGELVRSVVEDREYSPVWRGDATLRFVGDGGDDLSALAPTAVDGGYVFSYAETVVGGKPLDHGGSA